MLYGAQVFLKERRLLNLIVTIKWMQIVYGSVSGPKNINKDLPGYHPSLRCSLQGSPAACTINKGAYDSLVTCVVII